MFSNPRWFYGLLVLTGLLFLPILTFGRNIDDDIRIDIAADAQVHVENRYGGVSVETWTLNYVSVTASVAGDQRLSRSPIVIDNRGKQLAISVVRTPRDPVAVINVIVRIPDSVRLEVTTVGDAISLRGLPANALLKSGTGDITLTLPVPVNANINARSTNGSISSTLAAKPEQGGHVLQARLGNASKSVEVQTEMGQVLLTSDANAPASVAESTRPELVGPDGNARAGTPASAKDNGELSEGDVIRVDSQLVTLNMSVIDRGTNRGVTGLTQSDFKVFEDGREQTIVQFESSSAPFDLILLIDLSGSTKDVVKLIRAAALHFIEAARPADRIGIITFAGAPTVISRLTADRDLLRQRANTIDTERGDTKLYDATDFAMSEALKDPKKSRRTAIVLMSDGLDGTIPGVSGQVGSSRSYQELLSSIREFDGVLYTLWLNTRYEALNPDDTQPEAFDEGYDRMKEMADAGGGIFYEVNKLTDLAGAYEQVVADLGTTYSLAYRPTNNVRDGKWRAIGIAVSRSNAAARGKRGYYAK